MSSEGKPPTSVKTHVFIAGSGPIGCTFAREILRNTKGTRVWMAEIGAQNDPVIGAHHKNAIKYQKDIDSFVHVIQGALQPVSVPPASAHMPTLNPVTVTYIPEPKEPRICASSPSIGPLPLCTWPQWPKGKPEISTFFNPSQVPEHNLPGCGITRTVGGMATHWTCACPQPHREEYKNSPIGDKLPALLERAEKLLNVQHNQFDDSVRHKLVKRVLENHPNFNGRIRNLPLGVQVQENEDKKNIVTWTGTNTVLGDWAKPENCCVDPKCKCESCRFSLHPEHKVVKLNRKEDGKAIESAEVYDLRTGKTLKVEADIFIIACGAICTPQILWNSGFGDHGGTSPPSSDGPELRALGRYLSEQSIAFCQIVLKRELVRSLISPAPLSGDNIDPLKRFNWPENEIEAVREKCQAHQNKNPDDPLPIPFDDLEPQVNVMYTAKSGDSEQDDKPWHAQVHRDAFSYGDIGPRADPRLVVDLRFFGKQDVSPCNRVMFEDRYKDIYDLPQPTFEVYKSEADAERDHNMMLDMCEAAHALGTFLPGSYPQFMPPGLALHITGTTRIGEDDSDSVANEFSRVHGQENLYVGGNNVIPDATACNPTLTSVAYAIYSAEEIVRTLQVEQMGNN